MAKGRSNNIRYKYPLPIHPVDSLPQLLPHNPVSWVHWIYCYYKSVNNLKFRIQVEITGKRFPHITVKDRDEMLYLWDNGFFGTGQFSRSEPTWIGRATNRLAPKDESNQLTLEKVTEIRRLQRAEFKKERQKMEEQLLHLRNKGCSFEEEADFLLTQREALREFKSKQLLVTSTDTGLNFRYEDNELFDNDGNIIQLEALELMPVEAIFLSFALPVLDIKPHKLFEKLVGRPEVIEYNMIHKLIKQYVAYHHYRSHGWCVRSGIKFGCEYLLYKRGPPFQHAEFCIMVLDKDEIHDYEWYSSISRVVSGAKKTFVLCYMERLASQEDIIKFWHKGDYKKVFSSYRVSEMIYRRWMPGKNRD